MGATVGPVGAKLPVGARELAGLGASVLSQHGWYQPRTVGQHRWPGCSAVGGAVGRPTVGDRVGGSEGADEGAAVGRRVLVGFRVGGSEGAGEGSRVGLAAVVGPCVGGNVGFLVGLLVG